MRRRQFIAMAGSLAAWPLMAHAQSSTRPRRIGVLLWSKQDLILISPMLKGLEALGYVEGRNVVVGYVDVEGKHDRLAGAAAELASLNPDVIFSFGGEQAPFVKNATATIPIVVVVSNDPVQSGLVSSLGRPGGNITGVTYVHDMLAGKSVELLRDTMPSVSRVAILWNPNHVDPEFRETQRASRALGVQLQSLEIRELRRYRRGIPGGGARKGRSPYCPRLASDVLKPASDWGIRGKTSPGYGGRSRLVDGSRRAFDLRPQHAGIVPKGGRLRRQNTQGRKTN